MRVKGRAVTLRALEIPNSKHQIPNNQQITKYQMLQSITAYLPHSLLSLRILNIGICLGLRYCDLEFNVTTFKYAWTGLIFKHDIFDAKEKNNGSEPAGKREEV
jgi:hypothetical protein